MRNIFSFDSFFNFLFPLLIVTLPAFQVFIAWETCFPFTLACLASGYAYYLSSAVVSSHRKSVINLLLAFLFMILAFSVFQPAGMTFLFFFFLDVCAKNKELNWKQWVKPLSLFLFSLMGGFLVAKLLPFLLQIENRSTLLPISQIPYKAIWFIFRPFAYALQLYNIRLSLFASLIGLFLFILGLRNLPKFNKKDFLLRVLLNLAFIPASFLPNLISDETAFSFRIIIVVSPIVSTISFLGIRYLISKVSFNYRPIVVGILLSYVVISKQHNIYWGFIRLAQAEYQAMSQALRAVPYDFKGRVVFDLDASQVSNEHTYGEFNNTALLSGWAIYTMAYIVAHDLKLPLSWIEGSSSTDSIAPEVYRINVIKELVQSIYPDYNQRQPSSFKERFKILLLSI